MRGYSQYTIDRYRLTLNQLDTYLKEKNKSLNEPQNITIFDIHDYIWYIRNNWVCARSCNPVIYTIKAYFKYLKEVLELEVLDYSKIKWVKFADKRLWYFNDGDKYTILNAVNKWIGKKEITQIRNRLLTYMLLHTWLRVHEIAKIRVEEIWESLQVVGKWWKLRTVFLRKELLSLINLYLSKRKKESDFLFPAHSGDWHITTWSIENIYKKLSHQLGIHIHPHRFRHTFCTDLLHLPWSNIYDVARLMGHSKITTTQIYLGVDDRKLKELQFWLQF